MEGFFNPPFSEAIIQQKMLHARVTIIGVGGLGSWAAELLARMGLGRIRLIDCAVVREADLQQHMAVTEEDVDRAKVTVVADRLAAINSHVLIEAFHAELGEDSLERFLVGSDVVLDTTGRSAIRTALFSCCCRRKIRYVCCEANDGSAQVTVWRKQGEDEVLLPTPLAGGGRRLPATVALAASLSVQEIVKLLTAQGESLAGQVAILNTWQNTWLREPLRQPDPAAEQAVDGNGEAYQ